MIVDSAHRAQIPSPCRCSGELARWGPKPEIQRKEEAGHESQPSSRFGVPRY